MRKEHPVDLALYIDAWTKCYDELLLIPSERVYKPKSQIKAEVQLEALQGIFEVRQFLF